jgi:alkanesulfonate monooxygenase SsuD/methylene tetrahydromethanopterin reductase-like flavin-dependent oxidoreductase (luciferase family)
VTVASMRFGAQPWSQATDWAGLRDVALDAERSGWDAVYTWDHLMAIQGPWRQPIFEGWAVISAWAALTSRIRIGLMVGANTFRNPGHTAKLATTLDHISNGRAILGIGGAWMEPEHQAHGIDFGTGFGQRLDWLDEAVAAIRPLLDGKTVTSQPGGHYSFDELRHHPVPIQKHLPIMIGGSGEKKTLRTVAQYADQWNAMGTPEFIAHKVEVLKGHCDAVGRDISEIEFTLGVKLTIRDSQAEAERVMHAALEHNRTPWSEVEDDDTFWCGTPAQMADKLRPYVELGFHTVISEQPAPHDVETIERFIGEVKPLLA